EVVFPSEAGLIDYGFAQLSGECGREVVHGFAGAPKAPVAPRNRIRRLAGRQYRKTVGILFQGTPDHRFFALLRWFRRGCIFQLWAALCHNQLEDTHFLLFAVNCKFESLDEELLLHKPKLLFRRAFGELGDNVEPSIARPGRYRHQEFRNVVRHFNEGSEIKVLAGKTTWIFGAGAAAHLIVCAAPAGWRG